MSDPRGLTVSDAERARLDRVDLLGSGTAADVDGLIAMLSDGSWVVRRAVVAALAALGDAAADAVAAWLRDHRTSEHAIAAAVDALSAALGTAATQAALRLLADADPAVACDGASILGRRRAATATAALAHTLRGTPDDNVALAAIEALGAIGGSQAVDALVEVALAKSFFRTFPALQVLPRTADPRVVAPLAALLDDETYRVEAARALGRLGLPQAIRPLAALLRADADDARLAARALADVIARAAWTGADEQVVAALHDEAAGVHRSLVGLLAGGDATDRVAIAAVLGRIGDASVIDALVPLLADPEAAAAAEDAIRRIATTDAEALAASLGRDDAALRRLVLPVVRSARSAPVVRALLADADSEVRARACEALARIGDTGAVPALFDALADPSSRVSHAAVAAIHSLGSPSTEARALAALESSDPNVRRHALRVIGYMGWPGAYDALAKAIRDHDTRIAELAAAALPVLDDPRAEGALGELAIDPRDGVRAAAMRGAAVRGGPRAAALLVAGTSDRAAWVRYYACQGLGRLGGAAGGLVDATAARAVIACVSDPAPFVRIAAVEALGHLGTPAAWDALAGAAAATDPDERRAALASMSLSPSGDAVPFLLAGARATDAATRLVALQGLARSRDPAALAAVADAALGGTGDVRDAAVSLLAERDDGAAAEALVDVALATAELHPVQIALSRPGAARVAAISARLVARAVDDAGAAKLAGALARMRDEPSTAALAGALALPSAAIRRAVASALAGVGDPGSRLTLARIATDDPDEQVRQIARAALGA